MDYGSVKNVGIAVIDNIVEEREKNGEFESFISFCERMKDSGINKKNIESLIRAGVFDEFKETRATLMASFENIIDTIQMADKKGLNGQVTMFDIVEKESSQKENLKYNFTQKEEYNPKELLFMEKEMLGLYITGHPLEEIREKIENITNINSLKIQELVDDENNEKEYKDGENVKIAGIIKKVKKKFTKNNTIMAFVTIDDLYGSAEILVFDSCYQKSQEILFEDNVVLIDGRLSIREDEVPTIVAREINLFEYDKQKKQKKLVIDISQMQEEEKNRLKGTIKFFSGERNNIHVEVKQNEKYINCGAIFINNDILEEFKKSFGEERVLIIEK